MRLDDSVRLGQRVDCSSSSRRDRLAVHLQRSKFGHHRPTPNQEHSESSQCTRSALEGHRSCDTTLGSPAGGTEATYAPRASSWSHSIDPPNDGLFLGAAFAGLFRANQSVSDGTFDSTHESSYWTMIVLGLIGGTLLAQILPNDFEGLGDLTKPLLALLGGFSAPAVYSILDRLVQTVQALVQGDGNERVAAQEREAKARVQEEAVQNRMQMAAKIVKLQEQIYKQNIPEEVRAKVSTLLDDVLIGDLDATISLPE